VKRALGWASSAPGHRFNCEASTFNWHPEVMKLTRSLGISALAFSALAQSQVKQSEADMLTVMSTARIIQVLPEINQLNELVHNRSDASKIALLRQEIIEKVLAASLEVDATIAQIDNEIAQSNEVCGYLSDRRDKAVNRANLLSIVSGGALGATSAGLQLPSRENGASSIVGIAGGVLSSSLAISGIRAQKGGTRLFDFSSNMLAELFDRSALGDSRYDPIVWSFLNDVAPTDQDRLTRKERLIQTWITLKRTDPPSTSAGKNKIDKVTSQPSDKLRLTIDDLEDRSAMLEDVRAKISFLKRDLAALLLSLPLTTKPIE
jgi:hypothetical protein